MSANAKRVARGAGWLYVCRWGERLLDLVSIVVLARLLSPEDFGVVAIAASIVTILEGLSDFDVNKAMIRIRSDDRALFDTAWTLSAMRGLLATLLMVIVAAVLSEARISAVLFVLAVTPLFKGLNNPRFVAFERDLVYSPVAWLTLGSKGIAVALTLALAFLYRSYWALVLGIVAGALVALVLSYALRPYRPRFTLSRWRDIFAFSGWMSLTTMVTTLSMETDKIIVGRLLGIADAGRYFMTGRVGALPAAELVSPLQRILFPSFSEIAGDKDRLRRVVRESITVLGSLSLPAGFGFALVAGELVPLALGAQWLEIVPLLMILVPFLGVRATLSMTLPCVMALGETRLLFRVSFVYALVHVPAFVAGTMLFGLMGAIGSIVAAGLLYIYQSAWLLGRVVAIRPSEILGALKRPMIATSLMVAILLILDRTTSLGLMPESAAWPSLLAKIAIGGVVFAVAEYSLWRLEGRPGGLERRLREVLLR